MSSSPARNRTGPSRQASISGPSFLGLSEAPAPGGYDDLFDDDPRSSPVTKTISLLLLVVLAVVVATRWEPLKQWVMDVTARHLPGQAMPAPSEARPGAPVVSTHREATPLPDSALPQASDREAGLPSGLSPGESTQVSGSSSAPQSQATEPETTSAPAHGRIEPSADEQAIEAPEAAGEEPRARAKPPVSEERHDPLVQNGERYLYGRGVPRDCDRALVSFQAAADRGNPRALSHLGALYATGVCVQLNRARAYDFFSRALALDRTNSYLERNLAMLWRSMSPQEREQALRP